MTLPPPNPASPSTDMTLPPDSSPSHFVVQQFVPTSITAAWPPVVTYANHGLLDGQVVRATEFYAYPLARATGMYQLNNKSFYIQHATQDTFELWTAGGYAIDGRAFTPYISGGLFTRVGPRLPVENPAYPPPPPVPNPFGEP